MLALSFLRAQIKLTFLSPPGLGINISFLNFFASLSHFCSRLLIGTGRTLSGVELVGFITWFYSINMTSIELFLLLLTTIT